MQIEELKVPLSRFHLFEEFVKNDEIFYGNVKSCLFPNDLYKLLDYIVEFYQTKIMLSFKKLLQLLKLNPYLLN